MLVNIEVDLKMKRKLVVLVTGTPCVGKTSVSRMLASKLNAVHIDLAEIVKNEGLYVEMDSERGTLVADMEKLSKRIEEIVEETDKTVIIDGHYAMHVISPEYVDYIFVLRKNPKRLRIEMEKRGYSGRKLWENLAAEILDVCLSDAVSICGVKKVCEIDATNKNFHEVVKEIVEVLENKRVCRTGIVDWLGELEKEGILKDYLKNKF